MLQSFRGLWMKHGGFWGKFGDLRLFFGKYLKFRGNKLQNYVEILGIQLTFFGKKLVK